MKYNKLIIKIQSLYLLDFVHIFDQHFHYIVELDIEGFGIFEHYEVYCWSLIGMFHSYVHYCNFYFDNFDHCQKFH